MTLAIDRRRLLFAGVSGIVAGLLPLATRIHIPQSSGGICLYDPLIREAPSLARLTRRTPFSLVALDGDRVLQWRALHGRRAEPIGGVTRWSDFVLLRGLAAEAGMRLRNEHQLLTSTGETLFDWEVM
jgi:hypothetical protein